MVVGGAVGEDPEVVGFNVDGMLVEDGLVVGVNVGLLVGRKELGATVVDFEGESVALEVGVDVEILGVFVVE